MDFKKSLNEKQYEAVTTAYPFVRIVAGAGSGKTRVLTYRIAYLISEMGVDPYRILAITFTNKVANEMKERVKKLVPDLEYNLKIRTFHSFCARFLREEIEAIGYRSTFTIFDEKDQESLMKTIVVDRGFRRNDELVRLTLNFIEINKTEGRYPADIDEKRWSRFPRYQECRDLWIEYEKRLEKNFALDFDDLLIKTINILQKFPKIRTKWQKRFDFILIDEFQDTNDIQARLLHLLLKNDTSLYVVGDPDQTIYTWRGANQGIILDTAYTYFDKKYQILDEKEIGMETIILNRNYRSTKTILNAANALIDHNKMRVKKDLYTENETGSEIKKHQARTIDEEASWVVEQITRLQREERNFNLQKVAILVRAAYLTLPLEKALTRRRLPYVIYGGIRFYQREEIKDALAYFRIINNPRDEVSCARIINVPRRGLGDQSLDIIKRKAREEEYSLFEYLKYTDPANWGLRPLPTKKLQTFLTTVEKYRQKLELNDEAYSEVLREYLAELEYFIYVAGREDGDVRLDNLNALIDDIRGYLRENPSSNFEEYLQNVTLLSAQDDIEEGNHLKIMTVHTAKGLEFPYVFIFGLNEGIFPSHRALEEAGYIAEEEERRLCYVAFTRAQEKLFLSCNNDYSFVLGANNKPSRFFKEAGFEMRVSRKYRDRLFPEINLVSDPKSERRRPTPVIDIDEIRPEETWHIGDEINHKNFGLGKVIEVVGERIITVEFVKEGRKRLMGNHPLISKIQKGD
ncbi:MAG: ATP-dependent helicase [Bacilli bacterium]